MTDSIRELTILQPDDWHIHLRDDKALATTVPHAAQSFNRVICMPNLVPPVKNVDDAHAYRARIMQQLEASNLSTERKAAFDPRMTLYLTDNTSAHDIEMAAKSGIVKRSSSTLLAQPPTLLMALLISMPASISLKR